MRRCELAGTRRELLDLDAGTLAIEPTRVVVDGKVMSRTARRRTPSIWLRWTPSPWPRWQLMSRRWTGNGETSAGLPGSRAAVLLGERHSPTPGHHHPPVQEAVRGGRLPEIDLHDVRHSYATAGRNAKIDWKALSQRIGHADVAFTMKQYVQTDLEADRQVANTLAELIIGGALASFEISRRMGGRLGRGRRRSGVNGGPFTNPFTNDMQKAPSMIGRGL